ncbi:TPR repeat family protein [Rickettsia amblyommatis str. Darkwater]|uniref:TPR repeat family protein n=1 Tax=Rickettsia amblyommatis str. Ac/Pa TaxID=1359164 RepID=A0A0F3MZZ7_RICAM|nr:tetratricopeptide repeat protein [Rickettsia amblyommatis]KJV61330.1 TPR repeat family protein [Rickettsia amblyommatis str. Ac/Pa]KJV97854.1 TPR repeat family protein [Rickettsia amblyommatis str. Darkwater]
MLITIKAEILRKLKKYELALEAYNKAIEIDPNYSDAYFNKSKLFDELGNYEVALEAYDRALTYRHDDDLDYSDIYYNIGTILSRLQKYGC